MNIFKKIGLILLGIIGFVFLASTPYFASATITADNWVKTTISDLDTNTGNGLANASIHVAHCWIGVGSSTPCGGTGTVTSITASSPLTGGTITTTGTIGIPQASGIQNGFLSSGDWTIFNGKGTGTIGGSITTNQVGFGSASNTLAGNNDLTWNNSTKVLSVGGSGSTYFGNGITNATPANGVIHATGGSGVDVIGGRMDFSDGQGTGAAGSQGFTWSIHPADFLSSSTPNSSEVAEYLDDTANWSIGDLNNFGHGTVFYNHDSSQTAGSQGVNYTYGPITPPSSGLNDMTIGGASNFTGKGIPTFYVTISNIGGTDSFVWNESNGDSGGPTLMTGAQQLLADGTYIKFNAVTGHNVGQQWSFSVGVNPLSLLSISYANNKTILGDPTLNASVSIDGNSGINTVEGLIRGTNLHNNSSPQGNASQEDVRSGTYAVTPNNATGNITATSATVAQWSRVGDYVEVSGEFTFTSIGAGTFNLPLPVASNLTGTFQLAGGGFSDGLVNENIRIKGDTVNDEAQVIVLGLLTAQNFSYKYSYLVN